MNEKQTIMVVDDDPNIAQLVKLYLEKEGYEVTVETRGDDAMAAFQKNPPSLMLLDVMLPGMDGWQVCRGIRQMSNIPIIMLTAKDETFDKVLGLELGADDYITKPFEGKELMARVKAVLRRAAPGESEKNTLSFPGLTISLEKYEVHFQGKLIEMPPKELEVLYFLAAHQNRVFTREQLLDNIWGFDFNGDPRVVDTSIKRIRKKLPENTDVLLRSVYGVGYKVEVRGDA